ncbi:hypothetical protein PVK06_037928 [Gossypium arboreum]|uniref:Uncharacterized protein n=1 Tax=Gossypium arboreum TaxID=29729 RepID=A0ABR0N0L3_GOSAR|nr:hypothetical protein PVK06_037928 [Gossypium arboreum]
MASIASPSIYSYCTSQDHNKRISTVPHIALCQPQQPHRQIPRREIILRSSELAIIVAIFSFSGKRPDYLGVQKNTPALALCPSTKNGISTSENVSDITHYSPLWNYNGGRTRKKPIKSTKPDKYTPKIVEKKDDYVLVEYESPIIGIVDDVEFWFPPGKKSMVEYRSASGIGNFDFDALRMELEKKGWASEASF